MSADVQFGAALRALNAALQEAGVPWMVIGGVAVIASGIPRETIDVDATVLGRGSEVEPLLAALERHGIVPRIPDARQFAREKQLLLLEHPESTVTLELSFGWLPFEEEALTRARRVPVAGIVVPVAHPEDLIVYKATAWRERDQADIQRLLILHLSGIDVERIRSLIEQIAHVLDDPQRVEIFDAMVAKARRAAC